VKVTHVITALGTGGAEMMLYRLLRYSEGAEFEHQVVSMRGIGPVGEKIRALGIPVRALGMRRGVPNPLGLLRLARWLNQDPPDVVQSWMYQADLVGGLAARLAGGAPVVWGIHSAHLDPRSVKRSKIWIVRACAWSSRWLPTRIVCCSEVTREVHTALGYAAEKMLVIPNGSDLGIFKPAPEARRSVRRELGLREGTPLVGLVARFDSPKDHRTFVRAAALLHARVPEANFVLCGDGITWENPQLTEWIDAAGIRSCCHLLGPRLDVPRLTAGLDVASSSSSYSEAWPLVVGEAMACGVPCAVTDIGDCALIVGDTGRVVPPKDPEALADAWYELLAVGPAVRARLGLAARRRIEERFSLTSAIAKYEELYKGLALRSDLAAPLDASHREAGMDRKILKRVRSRAPLGPSVTGQAHPKSGKDAEDVSDDA
jgi:glycosyltransferase involved in cell wall biosynthesis